MKKLIQSSIAFFRRLFGRPLAGPTNPPKVSNLKIKRSPDPMSGDFPSYKLSFELKNENSFPVYNAFAIIYRSIPTQDGGANVSLPINDTQGHTIEKESSISFCFDISFDSEPSGTYNFYVSSGAEGEGFGISFDEFPNIAIETGSCIGDPPTPAFRTNDDTFVMTDPP